MRRHWANAPTIYRERVVCPHCGCLQYKKIRTADNGDGSATKLAVCAACHGFYKICLELPKTGNVENRDAIMPSSPRSREAC